ncbi:MAG: YncE family protein, partial [Candidatus Binatia bacterium]
MRRVVVALFALASLAVPAQAGPTRSSPLAVAPDGTVFAVNPDSGTIARLDFSGLTGVLTDEAQVGRYPRTLALAGAYVFATNQGDDTVSRCDQTGLAGCTASAALGGGCNPYGIAPTPGGDRLLVSCQGSSELLLLSTSLAVEARVALAWPNARAIAVSSDGTRAYVTHFLTEEPGTDGHVSVVDLANKSVSAVFPVGGDTTTCETQNSGEGVLNLLSAIALVPDGAPGDVAGQLWIGGTQQNNISKGLFKRDPRFKGQAGAHMFPLAEFTAFPEGGVSRNVYRPSFHDVTRFGIVKLAASDGARVGKIDIDEANNASDIEFSADGTTAYVVDLMFNTYHVFNTRKGQGSDVTTLFAAPSLFGPGGASPAEPCVQNALQPITNEAPFRMTPQAQITPIDGYDPFDATFTKVNTGVEFDGAAFFTSGTSRMRHVPDGIGTAPIGVRLRADGQGVYVLNYLSRNVVPVAAAEPLDPGGKPVNLRCLTSPTTGCGRNNDCPAGAGFCNHPGGSSCQTDADCGSAGPCIRSQDCVPMILGTPVSTITGRCEGGSAAGAPCKSDGDCAGGGTCEGIAGDPLPPALLDGKILFNTAARDASVPNGVGLGQGAPLFNEPRRVCANDAAKACRFDADCPGAACGLAISTPGEVVSTSHDASYVTCTACHADFGGQDGRTWDFSQFGASLRNTMDLRGRPGFAPGTCSNDGTTECFFDAACGDGNYCKANPAMVPPSITNPADRARWFNPMLTIHWNGDRDEVEDFEFTYRQLQGGADCDAAEDLSTCPGALVQRNHFMTSELPRPNTRCRFSSDPACEPENDAEPDLGPPNRNLPG